MFGSYEYYSQLVTSVHQWQKSRVPWLLAHFIQPAHGVTEWFGHVPSTRLCVCRDYSLPSPQPNMLGEGPPSKSGRILLLPCLFLLVIVDLKSRILPSVPYHTFTYSAFWTSIPRGRCPPSTPLPALAWFSTPLLYSPPPLPGTWLSPDADSSCSVLLLRHLSGGSSLWFSQMPLARIIPHLLTEVCSCFPFGVRLQYALAMWL